MHIRRGISPRMSNQRQVFHRLIYQGDNKGSVKVCLVALLDRGIGEAGNGAKEFVEISFIYFSNSEEACGSCIASEKCCLSVSLQVIIL